MFSTISWIESEIANTPKKNTRPIASGALPIGTAGVVGIALATLSLTFALLISAMVAIILVAYAILNVTYSLWLKHVVIVDVFCIALGFVLRILSGGLPISVNPSSWLIVNTFLLALFLALAKRRHELSVLGKVYGSHRPVLEQYTIQLTDQLISVATPLILITYLLYTLDINTIARFGSDHLYFTGVFVIFGIFRYLYLVHHENLGGSPSKLMSSDLPLLIAIICWVFTYSLIIYIK